MNGEELQIESQVPKSKSRLPCLSKKNNPVTMVGVRQDSKLPLSRIRPNKATKRQPASKTSSNNNSQVKIGSTVTLVCNGKNVHGIVKFIGPTEFSGNTLCGVQLKEPLGKNNGTVNGKTYFTCSDNHGVFVPLKKVSIVPTTLYGNFIKAKNADGVRNSSPQVIKVENSKNTSPQVIEEDIEKTDLAEEEVFEGDLEEDDDMRITIRSYKTSKLSTQITQSIKPTEKPSGSQTKQLIEFPSTSSERNTSSNSSCDSGIESPTRSTDACKTFSVKTLRQNAITKKSDNTLIKSSTNDDKDFKTAALKNFEGTVPKVGNVVTPKNIVVSAYTTPSPRKPVLFNNSVHTSEINNTNKKEINTNTAKKIDPELAFDSTLFNSTSFRNSKCSINNSKNIESSNEELLVNKNSHYDKTCSDIELSKNVSFAEDVDSEAFEKDNSVNEPGKVTCMQKASIEEDTIQTSYVSFTQKENLEVTVLFGKLSTDIEAPETPKTVENLDEKLPTDIETSQKIHETGNTVTHSGIKKPNFLKSKLRLVGVETSTVATAKPTIRKFAEKKEAQKPLSNQKFNNSPIERLKGFEKFGDQVKTVTPSPSLMKIGREKHPSELQMPKEKIGKPTSTISALPVNKMTPKSKATVNRETSLTSSTKHSTLVKRFDGSTKVSLKSSKNDVASVVVGNTNTSSTSLNSPVKNADRKSVSGNSIDENDTPGAAVIERRNSKNILKSKKSNYETKKSQSDAQKKGSKSVEEKQDKISKNQDSQQQKELKLQESRNKELQQQIENLENQLKERTNRISELEETITKNNNEFKTEKLQLDSEKSQLEEDVQSKIQTITENEKKLEKASSLVNKSNKGIEALTIVVKYYLNQLNQLSDSLDTSRSSNEELISKQTILNADRDELTKTVAELNEKLRNENCRCETLQKEIETLNSNQEKEISRLREEFHGEKNRIIENHKNDQEKEICKAIDEHQKEIANLQKTHEGEIQQLKNENKRKLEELREQHDRIMKEKEEQHHEVVKKLNSDSSPRLKSPVGTPLSPENIPEEVKSLHFVLEMKTDELKTLRNKNMELQRKVDEYYELQSKFDALNQKNQSLSELLKRKSNTERQLSAERENLMERFEQESKKVSRLSMEREQLIWRASNPDLTYKSLENLHEEAEDQFNGDSPPLRSGSISNSSTPRGRLNGEAQISKKLKRRSMNF